MPSDHEKLEELCIAKESVSSRYEEDTSKSPGEISESLFSSHHLSTTSQKAPDERKPATAEDLERARRCGAFGESKPSELFLRAYWDVLQCLQRDPIANCVSPSLCGRLGYVPMTIIAPLNDQLRHMSNLIVRAKREVLLATNFWKASGASTFVSDAMLELSKRAGERGERIVFKLMFDRGSLSQVWIINRIEMDKPCRTRS